jgi:DtxR family Mn-dependent transcriptional regulator
MTTKMSGHLENVLEAILMASELGDTSLEGIRRANPEDAQVEITLEDIEALGREGCLVTSEDQVALTDEGMALGRRVLRRHRLAEMLLFTLLGVDRTLASEIGCMVEHGIREEMLDGVCTLLGHPSTCPHGRPIPPGKCCEVGQTRVETQVVPLSSLRPGERARIVYVQPRSHQRLHRLSSLGLNPGTEVTLHRRRPAFCLRFEGTEVALDIGVADDIQVSRLPAEH